MRSLVVAALLGFSCARTSARLDAPARVIIVVTGYNWPSQVVAAFLDDGRVFRLERDQTYSTGMLSGRDAERVVHLTSGPAFATDREIRVDPPLRDLPIYLFKVRNAGRVIVDEGEFDADLSNGEVRHLTEKAAGPDVTEMFDLLTGGPLGDRRRFTAEGALLCPRSSLNERQCAWPSWLRGARAMRLDKSQLAELESATRECERSIKPGHHTIRGFSLRYVIPAVEAVAPELTRADICR